MDTQTIELLLGFNEIQVEEIELKKTEIVIHCRSKFEEGVCPSCLKKCKKVKSKNVREIRDMSLLGRDVYLYLESRQFHCEDCDRYFQERFSFVEPSKTQTVRFEQYLYRSLKNNSFQFVAVFENVLWDVLQSIFDRYSQKEIKNSLDYFPKRIGIDEFAYRKGKKDYAVVIVDLDRGCVWDVLAERDKESLEAYFLSKGDVFCQGVGVVSCDMWEGFSNTAKAVFPNVEVVIDRFHFFQHCNQVLDSIRKELRRQDPSNERFKSVKWLLYKAWKDLSPKQKTTLLKAFKLSPTLRKAYFLKVELQNIFDAHMDKAQAERHIDAWMKEAQSLAHQAMNKFLKTFHTWKNDILNFFTHRVSNGIVEGINNAIKTLKRNAYGFRNFQHFRARILVKFL